MDGGWRVVVHPQVGKFLAGKFDDDTVSLIATRPRLMVSHLWSVKRNGMRIPAKWNKLQALVDRMVATPKPKTDLVPIKDDSSQDDGSEAGISRDQGINH